MGIQPIRKVVAPEIPDKLYFRIGDVARICEVAAYVLRFWETEFPQLKPTKGGTGQRLYRRRDVEMALRIKSLLYDQRYTIPGARQVFKDEVRVRESAAVEASLPVPAPGFAQETGHSTAPQPRNAETAPKISSMAARTQISTPATDNNPADAQRLAKLSALRDDMRALLVFLGGSSAAGPGSMRPRLVLEPRPSQASANVLRPETLRLVREPAVGTTFPVNQGDLFSGE